jgi:DNA-binding CsgD family transcriptional regulator
MLEYSRSNSTMALRPAKTNKQENEKPTRSDKYQYLIAEIATDLDTFAGTMDLEGRLHHSEHTEAFKELNDQALECIMSSIEKGLTKRQYDILSLYFDGYTQMEIAKALDCNQSSVTKSIAGNKDYTNKRGKGPVVYGGSLRKIKKMIMENMALRPIIKEMSVADDMFYKKTAPIFVVPTRTCSVNLYYMVGTMFDNDDQYKLWQEGCQMEIPKNVPRK